MLIPLTSAGTRQLLQDLQKITVSMTFRTLLQNLQLCAKYTSAITGLRILQNLQNLRFFANFTIFRQLIAKFVIFYTSL